MAKSGDVVDILIVDDRIDGLITLEAVLSFPNINLVKAQSGQEALDILHLYDFGVILLDVQMPEMDGFETATLIRKHEKYKKTPIIFVTAINKDDRYIYRGYEVGAVDYIFKPFEPQILRSKVSIFVDLFIKSRQLQKQAEIIRESERRERYLRLTELEVESLKRYRNLADAIPHMVWRARADGTLEYFNRGWTEYSGLSEEDSLRNGWQLAVHQEDIDGFLKIWMNAMVEGQSFEAEVRIKNKQDQYKWYWIKVVAEYNRAGFVVAWLGTCTDINDRKKIEIELKSAEQAATAANLSKTSFLANMSHEIRTPMNAILGFTEMMQDPEQTFHERLKCISIVHRSGKQLLKIIDEILDISKIEAGHIEVENVEVNIGTLLSELYSLFLMQAEEKGLNLTFSIKSELPLLIFSDPNRLRQILLNIIGNAVKFTQKGHVIVEIMWIANTMVDKGKMKFRIIDSGVGITSSQIEKLFKPFMQADSSTTRNFGGTGLGLALSRKLARALGGDIFVEKSEIGFGSQFMVELELTTKKSTPYIRELKSDETVCLTHLPLVTDRKLSSARILLAEDSVDNQELITRFLNLVGARVDVAENGVQAIEKVMSNSYDLILMDIQMPILDGYEATKALRDRGCHVPIVALTAHALNEEREKSIEAGCDTHLTKPIGFQALVTEVSAIIGTKMNNSTGELSV